MGPKGGAEGCWCMLWRHSAKAHRQMQGDANRQAMEALVAERPTGLLAYRDGVPSGWISIAPRGEFPRMDGSRILKPVDEAEVWSVTCFFIAKAARRAGLPEALLTVACDWAASEGARIVEGYPIDPLSARYTNAFAWTGYKTVFDRCGFEEVARRSEKRPLMRRSL